MDIKIVETNSKNSDFIELIKLLDDELYQRYGDIQKQFDQHNKLDYIKHVIVIFLGKLPIACGAFKEYDKESVELKRIFVRKENRGQGLSKIIVNKLEEIAKINGYEKALLETGINQPEAINLYKKCGYAEIDNYGPYIGSKNSVCMKKQIIYK